ncbi:TPA: hypothetical protein ACGOVD_001763 [Streptococcus suis]
MKKLLYFLLFLAYQALGLVRFSSYPTCTPLELLGQWELVLA